MWPIVTDGSSTVGLSRLWALQKWLNHSRCHLGWCVTLHSDPAYKGAREKRSGPLQIIGTLCCELCINGCTDWDVVWDAESGGSREPCKPIRWGCTFGATRQIHCNRQCVVAMQPYVKLLWPFVGVPFSRCVSWQSRLAVRIICERLRTIHCCCW